MNRALVTVGLLPLLACPQANKASETKAATPEIKTKTSSAVKAVKELQFYTFPEYMDPEILKDFERDFAIKVKPSYYESTEEMLAKLQHADGAAQYDLIVVSQQTVPIMARLGLLMRLDQSKIPNLYHL